MPAQLDAVGTAAWVERTGGRLAAREKRDLLRSQVGLQLGLVGGRLARASHLNAGRRASVRDSVLHPPRTRFTIAAEREGRGCLPPAWVNHGFRTYAFGAALADLDGRRYDRELLFMAAMLSGTGLLAAPGSAVDFTARSVAIVVRVADDTGLSTLAREAVADAIARHVAPSVRPADGVVAHLLWAGAGLDRTGLWSWRLPDEVVEAVLRRWPRLDFTAEFLSAWQAEARRVPDGRARLWSRCGFELAVRLAHRRAPGT